MSDILKLSASRMGDYKDCPTRYKLPVIDRVFPDEDSDIARVGTNWHEIQHHLGDKYHDANFNELLIDFLNETYEECPSYKTLEEWSVERITLLSAACAYKHIYANQPFQTIASELEFELPLLHPETGRAIANVRLRGKIDRIIQYPDGRILIREYKSTGSAVDTESTYWQNLRMAMQPSIYYDAALRLGYAIEGVEYDLLHRPGIKPKKLSQADSRELIDTKKYLGVGIEIKVPEGPEGQIAALINDELVETIPGAKEGTFAIKETPGMYGIRLLQDMVDRQNFYFCRQEIPRTPEDMHAYRWELYNVYQAIKLMKKQGCWFKNERQCEATFKCSYIPICYNNVDVNERIPDGFHKKEIVKEL